MNKNKLEMDKNRVVCWHLFFIQYFINIFGEHNLATLKTRFLYLI